MSLNAYLPFLLFVIAMTGTPGAGNLGMMATAQVAGFRGAVPFLCGATVGNIFLNSLVSLGVGSLVSASQTAGLVLKVGGSAYILYLAWRLLSATISPNGSGRALSFTEGLFLHPLNPKSWAMAVTGFAMLARPGVPLLLQAGVFVVTFISFQITFHSLWGLAGSAVVRTVGTGRTLVAVNAVLVAAMVGATAYALFVPVS